MKLSALALFLALGACTTVRPPLPGPEPGSVRAFSYGDFDAFLRRTVDDLGQVDYAAAAADRADLDRYLGQLAAVSPDSHPALFPTPADRLAYWINAYNASVISLVLAYYPIASVTDVRAPFPLRFLLPRPAGFFVFQRVELGGVAMSLYHLETGLVRERFADPRIHFALNCASAGCPRLPAEAFTPDALEAQLERETRRFLGEPRNVRVNGDTQTLHLSAIFDWYDDDFTDWLAQVHPDEEPTLASYVRVAAPAGTAEALRRCAGCRVEFVPYDWSLNDAAATR